MRLWKAKQVLCFAVLVAFAGVLVFGQTGTSSHLSGEFFAGRTIGGPLNEPGSYDSGRRRSVILSEDGSYSLGDHCQRMTGKYLYSNGSLVLKVGSNGPSHCFYSYPATPESLERLKNPAPPEDKVLTVAKWSGRIYLIDEDGLNDLVAAINSGVLNYIDRDFIAYIGNFYTGFDVDPIMLASIPDLSSSLRSQILEQPIEATVTKIHKSREHSWTATINKGSGHGVRKGLVFFRNGQEYSSLWNARVDAIRENEADLYVFDELKVGERLSTRWEPGKP